MFCERLCKILHYINSPKVVATRLIKVPNAAKLGSSVIPSTVFDKAISAQKCI